ncbi:DUF6898 family protein [Roseibium suaedae]|uniref:DUF6898 domain-containing protein n=1 Tax=Roseibium suaedae TaxID=735517 RepID=A0A1M7CVS8_9HYPH|nr:serine hydroxymethyltransferase [Roseibium suaedae]SHL71438.1 hypothetical protein SAMN05444272_1292 [Roseibium suaedae]
MSTQSGKSEVYIEFHPIGRQVKVTAVDATTGVEVSIMGPSTASQADLQTLAIRKLQRRLEQLQG